ncbi:UNVERIFIED_CONTAM: hypothetical protein K2H54_005978 [Gekko kuhli]
MWSATLHACLMVWGLWGFVPYPDNSFLPSDLNLTQVALIFQDFMSHFNKTYGSQEERDHRFQVFTQNLKVSCALQASELGTAQYGITSFSDLTESEFEKMFGIPHPSHSPTLKKSAKNPKGAKSCDWRKFGAITAVKTQGSCRSCWAFAAVSNIEALWNIHVLSPQNVSVQGGLIDAKHYPYMAKKETCRKDQGKPVAWIHDYEFLSRDEKHIAQVVASRGPVTALINLKMLQHYQKGIIQRPSQDCNPQHLDHAVLIVGYGGVKPRRGSWSVPYWIIQNSWGKDWGEKGYFRLHRGSNSCGIARYPVTAIVKNSGEKLAVSCPP